MLRHYKDGRPVSVDDGEVDNGNRVGCENNAHSECKGTSFVLQGENFSTLNKAPGRKLKLALRDGRGLSLEHADFDVTDGQRSYDIRMTAAAKAIEVEFKFNGELVVTAGHHSLGLALRGERKVGSRQQFSDKLGDHQWQFNEDDGTISPRGARHLVIGWCGHAQLVRRTDAAQLTFIRPGRGHSDRVSFLSSALVLCTSSSSVSAMSPSFRSAVVSPATMVAMMQVRKKIGVKF